MSPWPHEKFTTSFLARRMQDNAAAYQQRSHESDADNRHDGRQRRAYP